MTVQYQGVWSLQSAAQLQSTQRWVTDPLFENTTLLLQADDAANGAQNNTFLDSSTNAFAITRNGNTTQGSFTPFSLQPGAWGNFFGATQQKLSTTGMTQLGSDFTLEVWVYPTSFNDYNTIFDDRTSDGDANGVVLGLTAAAKVYFYTNAVFQITTSTAIQLNTWTHIALVRSGSGSGNVKIYINGIADATTATYTTSFTRTAPSIGDDWNTRSSLQYYGYLSNLRATTGALYTASFTPSSVPLTTTVSAGTCVLLTCQSNRFVDNSASSLTITITGTPSVQPFSPFAPQFQWTPSVIGGSGYFDGTGDNLTVPTSSANSVGSGSFYFEAWVYLTNPSVAQMIIADPSNTGGLFVGLNIDGGGRFAIGRTAVAVDNFVTVTWVSNQWYHLAVNRNSTSLQFFVNGTQVGSTGTNSVNYPSVGYRVGAEQAAGSSPFFGYMSGLRLIRSSVNTGNFTPPTAPPTAITNTALLLNFTNAGIVDATMKNNLETVGNAQVSTAVVKYGSGSLAFDGTGDYLLINQNNQSLILGTAPFTIEFWFNTTSSTQYAQFIGNETAVNSGFTILINVASATAGTVAVYNGAAGQTHVSTLSYRDGAWHHFALSRDSSGSRMFIDGTQIGSTNTGQASASFDSSSFRWVIGANLQYSGRDYAGYIDDLRVTKGIARYTQNFIPPSVALPRQ